MYVGWTLLYLGVALLSESTWLLVALPLVGGATHLEVLREEQRLQAAFGAAYLGYRQQARRYL